MIMETEFSEETSGKAIETDSNTNICIKYESEAETKPHVEAFPTENELEATNKLDISDIFCVDNLIKSELVELDQIETTDNILNETAAAIVLLEKIPKTETTILGDDPVSARNEEFDLHHNDNYNEDSDSNSDPEHDPFADVDCDSSFSQNSQISHGSNSSSAAQHKQTNPKDQDQLCRICNKSFSGAQNYRVHALKIHGTNEAISSRYSFKCQFCTSCFPSNETLNAHVTSIHETNKTNVAQKNQRRFKCPMPNCEEAFNFNGRLQNHLANDHSKERSFKCQEPNCGKAFKINGQLQRHMLFHLEGRPFKCPYANCHKAFNNNDFLTQHLQDHTKARQYKELAKELFKCDHCDRAFPTNYQLNSHRKTHPKEFFQCPDPNCDRQFKYKKNCNSHFAFKHSNKDTAPPLQCPEPNSEKTVEYKNSGSIYQQFIASLHAKKVQAVSFTCSEPNCGKRFKTMIYLREHLKNHTRQFKTNYFL